MTTSNESRPQNTPQDEPAEVAYRQTRFQAPPDAARLLLIRHGESAPARANRPFPLLDGQGDPELAPEGRRQAERVAERLAGEQFDAVYVTPLRRTAETAAPLLGRTGRRANVEPGLREVHLGEWEGGLFRIRVAEGHPAALRMREQQRWDAIPGAEHDEDFAARVRDAVQRLATRHTGERIAVFTHGGVIGQVLALATGAQPFAFTGADNGSISEVVVSGPVWTVRRFNDTAHLGGLG